MTQQQTPETTGTPDTAEAADQPTEHPGAYWLRRAEDEESPLEAVAAALCGLLTEQLESAGRPSREESLADELARTEVTVEQHLARLQAVAEVCSASKGQLAERVRTVLAGAGVESTEA